MNEAITKERLGAFSDGVFAVIITIMVLQLRLPPHPSFAALLAEWPTALSYVVSYFLIVIMWINHHFLWSFAKHSTPQLIFWNFVHMLCASLVPFATAWVAATRIAAVPVFVYAAVIVLVNLSYHGFAREVVPREAPGGMSPTRRRALARSVITISLFVIAMFLSLKFPLAAFALVTCVLITYAHPETPLSLHGGR
ncbi:MAG TPA: TMEM175 family protein [Candidatus Cybelea sp.]